jgi:hypothetical protein
MNKIFEFVTILLRDSILFSFSSAEWEAEILGWPWKKVIEVHYCGSVTGSSGRGYGAHNSSFNQTHTLHARSDLNY